MKRVATFVNTFQFSELYKIQVANSFFVSFLFWSDIYVNIVGAEGLLLHLIALCETHTHTR